MLSLGVPGMARASTRPELGLTTIKLSMTCAHMTKPLGAAPAKLKRATSICSLPTPHSRIMCPLSSATCACLDCYISKNLVGACMKRRRYFPGSPVRKNTSSGLTHWDQSSSRWNSQGCKPCAYKRCRSGLMLGRATRFWSILISAARVYCGPTA